MSPLDDVLPAYDARERHERVVAAGPEDAVAHVLEIPAAPDRVTSLLFAARRVPGREGTVLGLLERLGAREVRRSAATAVYLRGGRIEIAVAFWADKVGDGRSILRTETRVRADDRAARVAFRAYWLVMRPFSGLIRRRWLRAAGMRS